MEGMALARKHDAWRENVPERKVFVSQMNRAKLASAMPERENGPEKKNHRALTSSPVAPNEKKRRVES